MRKTYVLLLVGISLFALVAAANLQERPTTLYALLTDLVAQRKTIVFEFATPLSGAEASRTVEAGAVVVAEDHVCFGEPWNDSTRYRCTPFTNITNVIYVE